MSDGGDLHELSTGVYSCHGDLNTQQAINIKVTSADPLPEDQADAAGGASLPGSASTATPVSTTRSNDAMQQRFVNTPSVQTESDSPTHMPGGGQPPQLPPLHPQATPRPAVHDQRIALPVTQAQNWVGKTGQANGGGSERTDKQTFSPTSSTRAGAPPNGEMTAIVPDEVQEAECQEDIGDGGPCRPCTYHRKRAVLTAVAMVCFVASDLVAVPDLERPLIWLPVAIYLLLGVALGLVAIGAVGRSKASGGGGEGIRFWVWPLLWVLQAAAALSSAALLSDDLGFDAPEALNRFACVAGALHFLTLVLLLSSTDRAVAGSVSPLPGYDCDSEDTPQGSVQGSVPSRFEVCATTAAAITSTAHLGVLILIGTLQGVAPRGIISPALFLVAEGVVCLAVVATLQAQQLHRCHESTAVALSTEEISLALHAIEMVVSGPAVPRIADGVQTRLDVLTMRLEGACSEMDLIEAQDLEVASNLGKAKLSRRPLPVAVRMMFEYLLREIHQLDKVANQIPIEGQTDAMQDWMERTFHSKPQLAAQAGQTWGKRYSRTISIEGSEEKSKKRPALRPKPRPWRRMGSTTMGSKESSTKRLSTMSTSGRSSVVSDPQKGAGDLNANEQQQQVPRSTSAKDGTQKARASGPPTTYRTEKAPESEQDDRVLTSKFPSEGADRSATGPGFSRLRLQQEEQARHEEDRMTSDRITQEAMSHGSDNEDIRATASSFVQASGKSPADSTSCKAFSDHCDRGVTIDDVIDATVSFLARGNGHGDKQKFGQAQPFLPPVMSTKALHSLMEQLGTWKLDVFNLSKLVDNRPLSTVGSIVLTGYQQALLVDERRVACFLREMEVRYSSTATYHNMMHGADVMNNMVYMLKLQGTPFASMDPIEKLAALTAAAAHDVGHNGKSNRFHVSAGTPLALLYNDQSVLENMHCSLAFMALRADGSNFTADLAVPLQATFRSIVVRMILETDLAKHVQAISNFRQTFLKKVNAEEETTTLDAKQKEELLCFAMKVSDIGHSSKPFILHSQWTLRITTEMFQQGDDERELGIPCSPFMDRHTTKVAESQLGFFGFIVAPLFTAMDEYLRCAAFTAEVMQEIDNNRNFWKQYDMNGFDSSDILSNANRLVQAYAEYAGKLSASVMDTVESSTVTARRDSSTSDKAPSSPRHRHNSSRHFSLSSNPEQKETPTASRRERKGSKEKQKRLNPKMFDSTP